jgi:hypothetical protein
MVNREWRNVINEWQIVKFSVPVRSFPTLRRPVFRCFGACRAFREDFGG